MVAPAAAACGGVRRPLDKRDALRCQRVVHLDAEVVGPRESLFTGGLRRPHPSQSASSRNPWHFPATSEQPLESCQPVATLAPYPVDYFSTASYYWPNIVENATQISNSINSGTETYEPTPENGPFGFGAALKVDGPEVMHERSL